MRRLFTVYAAASLAPIVALGAVLLALLHGQSNSQGLADGRAQANIVARVSIGPLLRGDDLRGGLTATERAAVRRTVGLAVSDGDVLRLRLRDLDGNVVFADDGSTSAPDDEALEAAAGHTVAALTRLNADSDDPHDHDGPGARGPRVVEVYEPLLSARTGHRIGVVELYLPYAPIAARIAHAQHVVAAAIGGGVLLLWLTLLGVSASVTRRLRGQARLNAFLAAHDTLTGLPNRASFGEQAARLVVTATAERPTAIALVDVDRFRAVNDTLGHGIGDELLTVVAERLRLHLREGDALARLGGDEFGIVLPAVHGPGEVVEVLSRIRAVLAEPLRINDLPLAVEASVGFSLAPDDGRDVDLLVRRADVALDAAKRQHLAVVHYQAEHDHYDPAALTLVAELGTAIATDQLVLHYQPKVDLGRGTVGSVEALVRWQHPTRGLLYPDAFLPAAEQTELIEELTRWVLRTATAALPALDPSNTLSVAINISARSLVRPDFADDVLALLADGGTDPRRVILELTETALMTDPPRAARTLARLDEAGIRISIDDFGVGQTSLGYLATLPISELKIDKSFVLPMLADGRNAAIVGSVIELGHSLGFHVTAEGVETPEILDRLCEFGCDTAQGYLFSRPVPQADVPASNEHARNLMLADM